MADPKPEQTPELKPNTPPEVTPVNPEVQQNPEQFAAAVEAKDNAENSPEKKKMRERARELGRRTKDKVDNALQMSTAVKVGLGVGGVLLAGVLINKLFSSKKETESSNKSTMGTILKIGLGVGLVGGGLYMADKYARIFGGKAAKWIEGIFSSDEKEDKKEKEAEKVSVKPEGYITYQDWGRELANSTPANLRTAIDENKESLSFVAAQLGAGEALMSAGGVTAGSAIDLAKMPLGIVGDYPLQSIMVASAIIMNADEIQGKFGLDEKFKYVPSDREKRAEHFREMFKTDAVQEWLAEKELHLPTDQIEKTVEAITNNQKLKEIMAKGMNLPVMLQNLAKEYSEIPREQREINETNIDGLKDLKKYIGSLFADAHEGDRRTMKISALQAVSSAITAIRSNKKLTSEIINNLTASLSNVPGFRIIKHQEDTVDGILFFGITDGEPPEEEIRPLLINPDKPLDIQHKLSKLFKLERSSTWEKPLDLIVNPVLSGFKETFITPLIEKIGRGENVAVIAAEGVVSVVVNGVTTKYFGGIKLLWDALTDDEVSKSFGDRMELFMVGYGATIAPMLTFNMAKEFVTGNFNKILSSGTVLRSAFWLPKQMLYDVPKIGVRYFKALVMPDKYGLKATLSNDARVKLDDARIQWLEKRAAIAEMLEFNDDAKANLVKQRKKLIATERLTLELRKYRQSKGNTNVLPDEIIQKWINDPQLASIKDDLNKLFYVDGDLARGNLRRIDEVIKDLKDYAAKNSLSVIVENNKKITAMEKAIADLDRAKTFSPEKQRQAMEAVNKSLKKLGVKDLDLAKSLPENQKILMGMVDEVKAFNIPLEASAKINAIPDAPDKIAAPSKVPASTPEKPTTQPDSETPKNPKKPATPETPDTPATKLAPLTATEMNDINKAKDSLRQSQRALSTPMDVDQYKEVLQNAENHLRAAGINVTLEIDSIKTPEDVTRHVNGRKSQIDGLMKRLESPEEIEKIRALSAAKKAPRTPLTPNEIPGATRGAEAIKAGKSHPADIDKPTNDPDNPHSPDSPHAPKKTPKPKKVPWWRKIMPGM